MNRYLDLKISLFIWIDNESISLFIYLYSYMNRYLYSYIFIHMNRYISSYQFIYLYSYLSIHMNRYLDLNISLFIWIDTESISLFICLQPSACTTINICYIQTRTTQETHDEWTQTPPRTEEFRLKIITTVEIINKFSRESRTYQNYFLGNPQNLKQVFTWVNCVHVTQKRGQENSPNLKIQIF